MIFDNLIASKCVTAFSFLDTLDSAIALLQLYYETDNPMKVQQQ